MIGGSDRVFQETTKLLRDNGHLAYTFSSTKSGMIGQKKNEFFIENHLESVNSGFFGKINKLINYFYSFKTKNIFEKYILKIKPDIIHLHITYGVISNSILHVIKKYSIPCLMTVHDYRLICPSYLLINGNKELCHKCEGKNFHNAIFYKCNNNSYLQSTIAAAESLFRNSITPYDKYIDHFIMVSNFSRQTHLKYLPSLKIKSSVLYNFYTAKNEANFEEKTDNFIYFGRLSSEKGILRLIDAFKTLKNLNLIIVGNGPLKKVIKSEISEHSNIKFLGFKKDKELEALIFKSKFTIVPSECYENNPMAIIESYYQGTPVIGSNIGGIPEIINDNSTGYLFNFMDTHSLKKILIKASNTDSDLYSLMNFNCKLFFKENFNNEYHYKKLITLYQKVINTKEINS